MISLKQIKDHIESKVISLIGGQKVMTLQIDITNACNLSCAHCYHAHHKNKGAISLNDWYEVINQYKALIEKLHLKPRIIICGGEPTISPLLFPVLKRLDSIWPKVKIAILTNGTRLGDVFLESVRGFNIEFQISLDGPDSKRHDEIRGNGNFDKAIHGLQLCQEKGIDISILAILSKKTSRWIEDFFKMSQELKIKQMNFTRFISQGSGLELENSGKDRALYPLELKSSMESILAVSKKYHVRTNTNQALYNLIDESLGSNEKYGFQGIIVDYKGNLKVSSRTDFIVGNILEEELENLFMNNSILKQLRKGKIDGCGQCEKYSLCGGSRNASYAATGSFLQSDPGCWINI